MLEQAWAEGIRTMIATPHYIPGHSNVPAERLRTIYARVCGEAAEILPNLRILLGNEIYYRRHVTEDLKRGSALTLAGTNYVLTEFSVSCEYEELFRAVREYTEAGYRPILAHVERYGCLYRKEHLADDLIDAGAYLQMNAQSLAGGIWDRRKAFCRELLREGRIHFLGSDCHDPVARKPCMQTVLSQLKGGTCDGQIRRIMEENAESLLNNEWV